MVINTVINKEENKITVRFDTEDNTSVVRVSIDTQDSFVCGNEPSSFAGYRDVSPVSSGEVIFDLDALSTLNQNGILNNVNFDKDMLFIFLQLNNGFVAKDTAYQLDDVFKQILNSIYNDIRKSECCSYNVSSIDKILALDGFNMAKTDKEKIYFWNIMNNQNKNKTGNGCNCP